MDYTFFNDELMARFTGRLDSLALSWTALPDSIAGTTVRLGGDVPDATADQLEDFYDELFDEQTRLAQDNGWVTRNLAGVQVTLPDGRERTVALPPELANRLLAHFTPLELADLVGAIAASLSHDFSGPICKHPGN